MNKSILLALLTLLLTSACAKQASHQTEKDTLPEEVRSIVVLPVVAVAESDADTASPKVGKQMQSGIETMNQLLGDYFANNAKVHMLSSEELDSHRTSYNANQSAQALAIAKDLKSEAVMTCTLKRFRERSGGDYSVQDPASVAFDYRLVYTGTGQTLCAGSFDETQQSITDNLLSLKRIAKRGFKWITAADLAREGVSEKLTDCNYFK